MSRLIEFEVPREHFTQPRGLTTVPRDSIGFGVKPVKRTFGNQIHVVFLLLMVNVISNDNVVSITMDLISISFSGRFCFVRF